MPSSHAAPTRGKSSTRARRAPSTGTLAAHRGSLTDAEIDRLRELLLRGLERAAALGDPTPETRPTFGTAKIGGAS